MTLKLCTKFLSQSSFTTFIDLCLLNKTIRVTTERETCTQAPKQP